MKKQKNRLFKKIAKSPINYFSDLFIVSMVVLYIFTSVFMTVMAIYSTIVNNDNSIWTELGTLVGLPITVGGGIWLIKCAVQHAIANSKGKKADYDFPPTDDDLEN